MVNVGYVGKFGDVVDCILVILFDQIVQNNNFVIVGQYCGLDGVFVGDQIIGFGCNCVGNIGNFLFDIQVYCVIFGDLWMYCQFDIDFFMFNGVEWIGIIGIQYFVSGDWDFLFGVERGFFIVYCQDGWG